MIRVLVVDDSSFMRKSLTYILESDTSIEVVSTAADGEDGLRSVKQFRPDVVLLDIEMPVMDGLTALAHIMAECPTPVLMLSGLNKRDTALAIKSVEQGAVEFIPKPSGVISYDIDELSQEIIEKVKIAAGTVSNLNARSPKEMLRYPWPKPETKRKIVIIGASTGGPRAVATILSVLPGNISSAILVVQHMSPAFIPSFVERLQWGCNLRVSTARKGEVITSGRVMIAPGGYHTAIQNGDTKKIRLRRKALPQAVYPSIDCAMESAARAYGRECLGVLLTGIGSDGARGMRAIKETGGSTIAEDESSCVVFGMPKAAIDLGCVDEVVPLPQIAQAILKMI